MEGMFDLDMALSMITMQENYIQTKLMEKRAFNLNQLSAMPTVAAAADDGECAVCMEAFEASEGGKRVPCGHVFHSTCIARWLSDHNSCPLCRSIVFATSEQDHLHDRHSLT